MYLRLIPQISPRHCNDGAFNISKPFSRDQEREAIDGFCDGTVIKVARNESFKSWVATPLTNRTDLVISVSFTYDETGCQPREEFVLGDHCREATCDWGVTSDETYGGSFVDNGGHGCVSFIIGSSMDWSDGGDNEGPG